MTTQRREMACSEMLLGPRSAALIFFSLLFSLLFSSLLCVLYVHVHIHFPMYTYICTQLEHVQNILGICIVTKDIGICIGTEAQYLPCMCINCNMCTCYTVADWFFKL